MIVIEPNHMKVTWCASKFVTDPAINNIIIGTKWVQLDLCSCVLWFQPIDIVVPPNNTTWHLTIYFIYVLIWKLLFYFLWSCSTGDTLDVDIFIGVLSVSLSSCNKSPIISSRSDNGLSFYYYIVK